MIFYSPTNSWAFLCLIAYLVCVISHFGVIVVLTFHFCFLPTRGKQIDKEEWFVNISSLKSLSLLVFLWNLNNSRWIEACIRVVYTDLQSDSWNSVPNRMLKFLIKSMIQLNKYLSYYPVLFFIMYLII